MSFGKNECNEINSSQTHDWTYDEYSISNFSHRADRLPSKQWIMFRKKHSTDSNNFPSISNQCRTKTIQKIY